MEDWAPTALEVRADYFEYLDRSVVCLAKREAEKKRWMEVTFPKLAAKPDAEANVTAGAARRPKGQGAGGGGRAAHRRG